MSEKPDSVARCSSRCSQSLGDWEMWWVETDSSMTGIEARSQDEARELYESASPSRRGTVRLVCDYYDHRKRRVEY